MIKKGFKGRCQKRQMKKCKEVVRTYGAIQLSYAERLEQEDSIIEFQCNVMLSGLEAGEYSSDFVCEKPFCFSQTKSELYSPASRPDSITLH